MANRRVHGSVQHKGIDKFSLPRNLHGLCAAAQTRAHAVACGSQGAGEQIAPVPARHLEEQPSSSSFLSPHHNFASIFKV